MTFELTETRHDIRITLSATLQGKDGVFWIYGGDTPHIGAVSTGDSSGFRQLSVFPGHREDGIVTGLARCLLSDGRLDHFVICGGIHYEDIPPSWIPEILDLCEKLGARLIQQLDSISLCKE